MGCEEVWGEMWESVWGECGKVCWGVRKVKGDVGIREASGCGRK